ncbi:MAG: SUMF1/EgtB/PvdO family nonheme iron enzyme [Bacteroidetes bacterium]|nr:SUMF1/EgtB/PvdO family nonheme iron enzyme [Bacteroidota bacterium]MCL2301917.1 SUMF1/EgtB/PvdO family nonheme iron enzyme [Lentimicrobiaceae bacterium]
MKRNLFNLIAVAVLLFVAAVACNKEKRAESVTLSAASLALDIGDSTVLRATVWPGDAVNKSIKWNSDNSSVATVNDRGVVTARGAGTAKITVTTVDGGHQATCVVTVAADPEPPVIVMIEVKTNAFFYMGCTDGECPTDGRESPTHYVQLTKDYQIAKYPVTQKEWVAVMRYNPSHFQGNDLLPVENVTWAEVEEFLEKLNAITGKNYRLATEAEWEFAARGGKQTEKFKFSGSNDLNDVAWHQGNSGGRTHPVGLKKANELGIHDMSGNVWEWCSDLYGAYPMADITQVDPTGPTIGGYRVARGGSWKDFEVSCRVSARYEPRAVNHTTHLGFRLAHDAE